MAYIAVIMVSIALTSIATEKSIKLSTSSSHNHPDVKEDERLFLTSPLLAFADGKGIGIHAEYIGFMLQVIRELTRMQEGEKDSKGVTHGLFSLQGKRYTLRSLRTIEMEYDTALSKLHQQEKDMSKSDHKNALDAYKEQRNALTACFEDVRNHFIAKILPFNEHASGVKEIMLSLVQEFCAKRNKEDSSLLLWTLCEEGHEEEMFRKDITSFKILDTFVNDITMFIKDIVYSCPKARADFLKLVKQKMNASHEQHTDTKKD